MRNWGKEKIIFCTGGVCRFGWNNRNDDVTMVKKEKIRISEVLVVVFSQNKKAEGCANEESKREMKRIKDEGWV